MRSYRGVLGHGLVVLVLVLLSAPLLLIGMDTDFVTWGAVMVAVGAYELLVALGAPWSLLWFASNALGTSEAVSNALFLPLVVGGALFNVVVHYRWRRRRLRPGDFPERSKSDSELAAPRA